MTDPATAPPSEPVCSCGQPGTFWGGCESCGLDRWVVHHCPFPCDDVTCENVAMCLPCLGAAPCPAHDDEDYALMLATAGNAHQTAPSSRGTGVLRPGGDGRNAPTVRPPLGALGGSDA